MNVECEICGARQLEVPIEIKDNEITIKEGIALCSKCGFSLKIGKEIKSPVEIINRGFSRK